MGKRNLVLAIMVLMLSQQAAFSQFGQAIVKNKIPNTKYAIYNVAIPLSIADGNQKGLRLNVTFSSNDSTGEIKELKGFDVFTTGLGRCFKNDKMEIELHNGKKLNLLSASPEMCDMHISNFYILKPSEFDILFSSTIKNIRFTNGKTGEQLFCELTHPDEQGYFLTIKNLYDKKEVREL